ncbi:DUF4190 domain-containing protein [Cellulomonas cellasea]|uniref:Putative membrane protein n=1 Tax=Cellulomonas cellasea TaxID=43670 RepID=A0A7W4UDA1_9CELL|nr:DUF4190 domain-containing protein [Cellulomonas cellasea]MBB2922080.1 putative membrane protein [Cellulomonas cellasea]
MSTPNEPQDPYAAGNQPEQPSTPGSSPYPSAPQYGQGGGYPQAPQYGNAPAYGGGYGGTYPKNNLGVWALVLGLVSFFVCSIFTGIPAIIVGNKGRKAAAAGEANNAGMSLAGVILGWVSIAFFVLGLIWLFALGGLAAYMESMDQLNTSTY